MGQFDRSAVRGGLTTRPGSRALVPGPHVVRLVALDAVGNRTVETWRFRVRR